MLGKTDNLPIKNGSVSVHSERNYKLTSTGLPGIKTGLNNNCLEINKLRNEH